MLVPSTQDNGLSARLERLPTIEANRWNDTLPEADGRRYITFEQAGINVTISGSCWMTLEQFCEEVEARLSRWRKGRYLVWEAAQILAGANAVTDEDISAEIRCERMWEAASKLHPTLTVRLGGIPTAVDLEDKRRFYLYTVLQSDVNEWLTGIKAGYTLDYPYHTPDSDLQAVPVITASTHDTVAFDKAAPLPVEQGLLTKDIAACFGDCYYTARDWPKRLSGTAWLETARIARGEAGGASAVWNPLTLAQLMHNKTKDHKSKEKLMKTLNSRFTKIPALGPWRDAFNEYTATYCDTA